jgi:hypothetical protein
MTCGTYQLSLEASAARPDAGCGSHLRLDGIFAGSPTSNRVGQTWVQMWDVKPAYPVAIADHHRPRPLERSP